ncbi:MAG: 18S rRNA maturation protein [Claussenomyces sp. TS43310]|nr:MAG: 18S rRNA maturation protein [Claussenomyces sp. TS43310]
MASKRKHSEMQDDMRVSRHPDAENAHQRRPRRPRRASPSRETKQKPAHVASVNAIKTRIRDITRRLERLEDLPADVRAEDERALAAYRQELAAAEDEKIRQKMIKRYHMVRFFERQKATRSVKRLRKQLIAATDPAEVERLKTELHTADVDLHYTQYSPLNHIYISIYPQKKDGDPDDAAAKRPEMWYEVERRMDSGGLDQLRNGTTMQLVHLSRTRNPEPRPAKTSSRASQTKPAAAGPRQHKTMGDDASSSKQKEARKAPGRAGTQDIQDGNISDGGFFEE